jgi:hypothetical protein
MLRVSKSGGDITDLGLGLYTRFNGWEATMTIAAVRMRLVEMRGIIVRIVRA